MASSKKQAIDRIIDIIAGDDVSGEGSIADVLNRFADGLEDGTIAIYVLPTASADTLGGIKVGTGLAIAEGGVLQLPAASASALGGIKVGTGLAISADGTLSVAQG